jgi:hypothetical protein
LLDLQAAVGNRAVSAMRVDRFESPEHQDLGDKGLRDLREYLLTPEGTAWAQRHHLEPRKIAAEISSDRMFQGGRVRLKSGVFLTPGEVISLMGDFYGTWEALDNAPREELLGVNNERGGADIKLSGTRPVVFSEQPGILDIMHKEREGGISAADAAIAYEDISGGRYLELAKRNDAHFARRNRAKWREMHQQALEKARVAGASKDKELMRQAMLIDTSGGHFLTDAFASGHMFDKDAVMAAIHGGLRGRNIRASNPEVQTYLGVIELSGNMDQLVLKNIHDRMNHEGFTVTNPAGMAWQTYGDDNLGRTEETQHIASLAVFMSRQQVEASHRGETGTAVDPTAVEELMPDDDTVDRATALAVSYVADAIEAVPDLVYRNRSMAATQFGPFLGTIVDSNLSTIGDPGRARQIEQALQSAARTSSGPIVMPSFTLAEWR